MRPLRIRPFSSEGLPHLPRVALVRTRALARVRAGLPAEVVVPLRGVGAVSVRPAWVSFVVAGAGEGVAFALDVRGQPARLVVDPSLALRLVCGVLGAPTPMALRPLGRAERGTLAAVVATFLDAAGARGAVRVRLDEAAADAPADDSESISLDLRVQAGAIAGSARLDVPMAALPGVPALDRAIDPVAIFPLLAVELARTTLPANDLLSAAPGDAVVFDGCGPLPPEAPWPVELRCGGWSLPATLPADGMLGRRGRLFCNESEAPMSDPKTTHDLPSMSPEAAQALAAAPVEVVAEIGRVTVRGDELVGLIEGGVLALGTRRPAEVQLRVGGRLWATGELVAIDDELGVRITELVRQ
jgi:flagellar motor switch protein FliN